MSRNSFVGLIAFGAAVLLLLFLCFVLFLPGEVVDKTDEQGLIHIEGGRAWVLFPWDCYTLSWSISDVQSITLDGWGVVNVGSVPVCIEWRNWPTFEIYHIFTIGMSDGTSVDIPVIQRALVGRAEFWGALLLVGIFVFVADRFGMVPWRGDWLRGKWALIEQHIPPLPDVVLTPHQHWFVRVTLIVIFITGLFLRVSLIYHLGESNYTAWSYRYYFGGLTSGYIGLSRPDEARLYANVYPPGYPFMLSTLTGLGMGYTGIRFVQSLIDLSAIFAIYFALRRTRCNLWLALLASAAYAIYPTWTGGAVTILGEWIMPSGIAWVAFTLLLAADRPSYGWWSLAGGLLGLLLTFRSEGLLMISLALFWLLWQRWSWKHLLWAGAALVFGFGLFVVLIGLKNLSENGVFTISSNAGSYALWSGLGSLSNDYGYFRNDVQAGERLQSVGIGWNTPESSQYWLKEYLAAWLEHPGYVATTILYRWNQIVSEQDFYLLDRASLPSWAWLMAWARFWMSWGCLTVIAASLIVLRDKKRLFLLLFPLVAALITNGFVYYKSRYVRYAAISYVIGSVFILDWAYTYFLRGVHAKIPRWKPEHVSLLLAVPSLLVMSYFTLAQFPHVAQSVVDARAADRERVTFVPETRTLQYQMHDLTWMPAPNVTQFDAQRGWLVTSWEGNLSSTSLWAQIPLNQASIVTVWVRVELVQGLGYISVSDTSGQEMDQALIQTPGEHELLLVVSTVGQSSLNVNVLAPASNSSMILEAVDVYTNP